MILFRKFRENNRRYFECLGFKFCYGKIPTKVKILQQVCELRKDVQNIQFTTEKLETDIKNQIDYIQHTLKSEADIKNQQICELKKDVQNIRFTTEKLEVDIKNQIDYIQHTLKSEADIKNQQVCELKKLEVDIKNQIDYIQRTFPIYLSAFTEHQKVFPKYKNCNKKQEMVLLASGPTLNDYEVQSGVKFLGINKSFLFGKVKLDYLFIQDLISDVQDKIDMYQGNNCKKFYGVHYLVPGIAQSNADRSQAERYYFVDMDMFSPWSFPIDCSVMPFNTYSSVVFPAAVFALWTGVSKLYLVGCDTNLNGYFCENGKNKLNVDNVVYGWKRFKEFSEIWYPETEIISVNPVGLRGLFHDVYTESYLRKHPKIASTKPEIMK